MTWTWWAYIHSKYITGSGRKQCSITKVVFKNFAIFTLEFFKKKRLQFSYECCRIFKITRSEEHLRTAASIRCYFDTMNLQWSGFCTTHSFNILVSEGKIKVISKSWISKKEKKILIDEIFYYKIPWFYQDWKSENPCFF